MPLLLAAIAVAFYWKLLLTDQFTFLDHPDGVNQVLPWLQFQAAEWQRGRFPLWDPHVWGGQPLVGLVQPGALSPLNWILFSLPLPADGLLRVSTLHWHWAGVHLLAALLAYAMCRDRKLSRAASLFAGCAFGFGGYLGTTAWPHLVQAALWLPLALLFFLRVVDGRRPLASAALSGACLGLMFLGGHHNVPIYSAVALAGLWAWALLSAPRRRALPCAAFLLCAALIAAAQILPAQEFGRLSYRWVNLPEPITWSQPVPWAVHAEYSLGADWLPGLVFPRLERRFSPFTGVVVLALAFLGIAGSWRVPSVRVLSGLALAGLLLALGGESLVHGILYAALPNLDKARTPVTAIALFQLGLIGVAAHGVDGPRGRASELDPWWRLATRALAGFGLFYFAALALLATARPEAGEALRSLALPALVALLLAGLLAAWRRGQIPDRACRILLVALLLFELEPAVSLHYRPPGAPDSGLRRLRENRDIAAWLRERPEPVRVEVDPAQIPYNFGDWFGIDQLGGALGGLTQPITRVHGERRARNLLATNYAIARGPARPDQTPAFEGASGLRVLRNDEAFPRVFAVHEAIALPDEAAVLEAVMRPGIDLRRSVVLAGSAPPLETCDAADELRLVHYEPDAVGVSARMACRGMLILADTSYPGWQATLDGEPVEIHPAYGLVRGVVVGAGAHEIRMRYRPVSVRLGAALAGLGLVLCAALQLPRGQP